MSQGAFHISELLDANTNTLSPYEPDNFCMESYKSGIDFIKICLGQLQLLEEELKSSSRQKLQKLLRALDSNLANVRHPAMVSVYKDLQTQRLVNAQPSSLNPFINSTRTLFQRILMDEREKNATSGKLSSNDSKANTNHERKSSYFVKVLTSLLIHQDHEAVELASLNEPLLKMRFGADKTQKILSAIQNYEFNRALLLVQNQSEGH